MKHVQFFVLEIFRAVDLTLHGPFTDEATFAAAAQKVRDGQDPETDSIFALQLAGGVLTQIPAPGSDDAESCSDCGTPVEPDDPYYATPCGTYCGECLAKHAKECGSCAHEFDLPGPK